uniref:LRAT domain-containing protein n=1 Tax=Poecilia reticulata TaxID=8081 RepID=A0A3P9Q3B9_POERE
CSILMFNSSPSDISGIRYKHFAVYVGDVNICGKNAELMNCLFLICYLFTEKYHGKSCKFSKMKMNEEPEVNNFLDDYADPLTGVTYGKGDDKDIIKRITETYQSSTIYGFLHNNCEHLATYVRYGVRVAVQVRDRLHSFFKHLVFRSGNKEERAMTQIKKMTIHKPQFSCFIISLCNFALKVTDSV